MRDPLRPVKRLIKQTPLWPLLRPRKTHIYGVGISKSGTTSIAKLFSENYRSGHEQHLNETVSLIRKKIKGSISKKEICKNIAVRENKMRLECESNSLLAYLSDELSEVYPRSKFILTVREPYSWLSSNLRHRASSSYSKLPLEYKKARDVRRDMYDVLPDEKYPEEEKTLVGRGMWNVEACLRYWTHQNETVLRSVPRNRLLIIKTSEISSSLNRIADFAEVPRSSLSRERSHVNKSNPNTNPIEELDAGYLQTLIDKHCSETISLLQERGVSL